MEILLGLLIIAIGSFGQSSSYVPIKKVKSWAWESFWIVQGIFAWLVFPFLGALLGVPQGMGLFELLGSGGALKSIVYGVLWGVGGLTFGLSMRYLGVALGQSISLGTCAGFGTLLPAIFAGTNLFRGEGLILLVGVCITLAGIAVIGYAGSLRSKNMTEEEKKAAIKDFALTKGLLVALLAGVMSACFALGLDAGAPIKEAALSNGVKPLFAGLPVILGGDLNTNTFDGRDKDYIRHLADHPAELADNIVKIDSFEPLLTACGDAGYAWRTASGDGRLTRRKPVGEGNFLAMRLDWIIPRGFTAKDSRVISTVTADIDFAKEGGALARFAEPELSDHNVVWASLQLHK